MVKMSLYIRREARDMTCDNDHDHWLLEVEPNGFTTANHLLKEKPTSSQTL